VIELAIFDGIITPPRPDRVAPLPLGVPFLVPSVCTENLSSGVVVVKSAKDGV
jgi:hypothetical protein